MRSNNLSNSDRRPRALCSRASLVFAAWRAVCVALVVWLGAGAGVAAERAERIVSMSPNLTQALFMIGAGDRVVGVSDFCTSPAEVLSLPRVGGWANPNYERLIALQPDLIVVLGQHDAVADFGRRRGIEVQRIDMVSSATIRSGVLRLGELTGREDDATSFALRFDAELEALRQAADAIAPEQRPRVFISITRSPGSVASLFSIGGGNYLDEAVRLAGGVNVFADLRHPFPQVSQESLLVRRPDVILELTSGQAPTEAQRSRLVEDWRRFPTLPAVRSGRIVVLDDPEFLIAGPGFPDLVRRLRAAIHGDDAH